MGTDFKNIGTSFGGAQGGGGAVTPQLILDKVFESDTSDVLIDKDNDGNPFSVVKGYIVINCPAGSSTAMNGSLGSYDMRLNNYGHASLAVVNEIVFDFTEIPFWQMRAITGVTIWANNLIHTDRGFEPNQPIDSIKLLNATIKAGTRIRIYKIK